MALMSDPVFQRPRLLRRRPLRDDRMGMRTAPDPAATPQLTAEQVTAMAEARARMFAAPTPVMEPGPALPRRRLLRRSR